LIRSHAPSYFPEWTQLDGEVDISKYDFIFEEKQIELTQTQVIPLPENFQTLTGEKAPVKKKPLKYLYSRGFTDRDILLWKIGFCNYGEYQNRIIVPSFSKRGEVNFFIARTYTEEWMKYKNPKVSKDIIFNDLNIDWDEDIILVEGVFDAMKCMNGIPMLGSSLRENSKLFQKICREKPNVYLALDADAKSKEFKIAKKLAEYGIKVMSIDVSGYLDIGEMPQEVVEQRKRNADIVSDLDYLHYKLDF
tara:strand:+ start:11393 stop:12139 length:747 start_codon:yes stop_codon:yes gene_type:complete